MTPCTRSRTTEIGFGLPSTAGIPATSIWSWAPTACTPAVRRLIFGPDEQFEKYLNIVVAAFEAQGYRPRDELVAMMHADVGFQAIRVSLRDDVTLFLFTVRHHGPVPR